MNQFPHKTIRFLITTSFLVLPLVAFSQTSLWSYYNEHLHGTAKKMFIDASTRGIINSGYSGTFDENQALLDFLRPQHKIGALAFPPSTVEGTSTAGWTDDGSIVRLNTATDFVGIGTTNPPQKLSITGGNVDIVGNITRVTGTAAVSGAVSLSGTTLNLGTGSATTTFTQNGNNLGISTTSPTDITSGASTTVAIGGSLFVASTTQAGGSVIASTTKFSGGPTYTWPTTDGNANDTLVTNGAGVFSFTAQSQGDYVLLQATTTAANMTFATTTFTPTNYESLHVEMEFEGFASAETINMDFNADAATNYGSSYFMYNSATPTYTERSANSRIYVQNENFATTSPGWLEFDIENQAGDPKWGASTLVFNNSGANAPKMHKSIFIWNNTSAQISSIVFFSESKSVNILAGTRIRVYGRSNN